MNARLSLLWPLFVRALRVLPAGRSGGLAGVLLALLLAGGGAAVSWYAAPAHVHAQDGSGITSPAPGATINGDVPILGTATIDPFQKYELHYKQEPSGDDAYIYFSGGTSPIFNGQLGVWQAGGLPAGSYTLRLRVVKPDGNYAEFYTPNITVNQAGALAAATPTATLPVTPTATPTFTPAPQPTAVIGQVTQPQVEGDLPPTMTPTPAAVAVDPSAPVDPNAAALPTTEPLFGSPEATVQGVAGASVTDQLGESLGLERLRTQFFNGVRISAALFIGLAALLAGKRLFEWVWKKYG